jgi:hypothetical protein
MPAVGCGLAGLPWLRVAPLIASAADHMDITVVILPHEPPPGSSDRRS